MKRIDKLGPQSGRVLLSGVQVGPDISFVFANSAAVNSQVSQIVAAPTEATAQNDPTQAYKIAVVNPSAKSDLTLKLFTVEKSLGGADNDCLLQVLDVPVAQTVSGTAVQAHEFLVGGIFCGGDLKIVASNNTALGASDGFGAAVRIREV